VLPGKNNVRFSVIVPTYNRPDALRRCLLALSHLSYPKDEFEVIVVDDGGAPDLRPIISPLVSSMNVKLFHQPNRGPASARDNASRQAIGEFLAFTDDDCEPVPEWLSAFEVALIGQPEVLAGGRMINALPLNPFAATSQMISEYSHDYFNGDCANAKFFESNNIAVARSVYRRLGFDGNFPTNAGEDRDFCDRWLAAGLKMVWAPDAVILHHHHMDVAGFCLQHFGYGRGAWAYATSRQLRKRGPVPFEGWLFHLGLVLSPFSKAPTLKAIRLSLLALLTQVCVIAGYACERFLFRTSRRVVDSAPLTESSLGKSALQ
jgi:glycosyltransferase involved in cell wall biosynthesis